jgi:hypothetical protein
MLAQSHMHWKSTWDVASTPTPVPLPLPVTQDCPLPSRKRRDVCNMDDIVRRVLGSSISKESKERDPKIPTSVFEDKSNVILS